MTFFEKITLTLQIITLIAATYIGVVQTQINVRQIQLQDYVAIAASPDNSGTKITLLNTGKVNLYISKIEIGDQTINYDQARLLPTGTLESSYYWLNPPDSLPLEKDFDLKVYVTDEYGTKWISRSAGQMHQVQSQNNTPIREVNLWSYKTEKI